MALRYQKKPQPKKLNQCEQYQLFDTWTRRSMRWWDSSGNGRERRIAEALRSTGNNQQQAAKAQGLSRQGLVNKVQRYRLESPA